MYLPRVMPQVSVEEPEHLAVPKWTRKWMADRQLTELIRKDRLEKLAPRGANVDPASARVVQRHVPVGSDMLHAAWHRDPHAEREDAPHQYPLAEIAFPSGAIYAGLARAGEHGALHTNDVVNDLRDRPRAVADTIGCLPRRKVVEHRFDS